MHAENLSRDAYRLDWERIEDTIEQNFQAQDRELLYLYFGLKGHHKTTLKAISKTMKLKPKVLKQKLAELERNLYKLLKRYDPDELILAQLHDQSLIEHILDEAPEA